MCGRSSRVQLPLRLTTVVSILPALRIHCIVHEPLRVFRRPEKEAARCVETRSTAVRVTVDIGWRFSFTLELRRIGARHGLTGREKDRHHENEEQWFLHWDRFRSPVRFALFGTHALCDARTVFADVAQRECTQTSDQKCEKNSLESEVHGIPQNTAGKPARIVGATADA